MRCNFFANRRFVSGFDLLCNGRGLIFFRPEFWDGESDGVGGTGIKSNLPVLKIGHAQYFDCKQSCVACPTGIEPVTLSLEG